MKKLFAMLLALAMVLSLVACGAKDDAGNDGGDDYFYRFFHIGHLLNNKHLFSILTYFRSKKEAFARKLPFAF